MTNAELRQRIKNFENVFIQHPKVVDAELAILDLGLRQQNNCAPETEILCSNTVSADTYNFKADNALLEEEENHLTQHCVLIVGEPGTGKTRLADKIKRKPEFRQNLTGQYGDIVPLLAFDMPDNPTPKSLVAELYSNAGLSLPPRITRNELASTLRRQLRQIGTKLIMIDEAHTLADGRKDQAVLEAARCLKFLLNTCGVPIVLLGEQPLTRLKNSKALLRRVDRHISIDPYNWSYENERVEFLDYLDQLDEALGFNSRCKLADNDDLASRLYFISGGHIGLVAKYLAKALKIALRAKKDSIDAGILAETYQEMYPIGSCVDPDPDILLDSLADSDNPFLVDRTRFKELWAANINQSTEVSSDDKSQVIVRKRAPKPPKNIFANG